MATDKSKAPTPIKPQLTDSERTELRTLVDSLGIVEVARQFGLAREAIARLVAQMPTRTGTVTHARLKLSEQRAVAA
jgi:DNA-binding CsgD family transcriptional regulator